MAQLLCGAPSEADWFNESSSFSSQIVNFLFQKKKKQNLLIKKSQKISIQFCIKIKMAQGQKMAFLHFFEKDKISDYPLRIILWK